MVFKTHGLISLIEKIHRKHLDNQFLMLHNSKLFFIFSIFSLKDTLALVCASFFLLIKNVHVKVKLPQNLWLPWKKKFHFINWSLIIFNYCYVGNIDCCSLSPNSSFRDIYLFLWYWIFPLSSREHNLGEACYFIRAFRWSPCFCTCYECKGKWKEEGSLLDHKDSTFENDSLALQCDPYYT